MSLNLLEFEEEEEHEVASFIPVGVVRPYQFEPIIAAGPNPTTARAHDSDTMPFTAAMKIRMMMTTAKL